jgi:hypothetical protein
MEKISTKLIGYNDCPNELGIYSSMILLKFPDFMLKENGGYYHSKNSCAVDPCLVDEILYLWSHEIHTMGCCCGHGKIEGSITVWREEDASKMIYLGYEYSNIETNEMLKGLIFKAKSIHRGVK